MKRFKIKSKLNRTKLQHNIAKYKKQQNFVVKLKKDSKLRYVDKIDIKKFKTFLE